MLREDCPRYCVFEKGVLTSEVASLASYTTQLQDMVTFYLGCSFSFERALETAGVPVRNVEQARNVSMFRVSGKENQGGNLVKIKIAVFLLPQMWSITQEMFCV